MTATRTPSFGFRVLGNATNRRRLIDAGAALAAYAAIDPKAEIEREAYLSAFVYGDEFRRHLRTAQAAMRHSQIDLTMNVYTDPALLDVRGALDALPALPLDSIREAAQATGTDGDSRRAAGFVAPPVVPTADNRGPLQSFCGNPSSGAVPASLAVSACPVNDKGRLSSRDSRPSSGAGGDRTRDLLNAIQTPPPPNPLPHKGDASGPANACTTACTSKGENANAGTVEALAAALLGLSAADRARLAAMLVTQQPGQAEGKDGNG